MPVRKGNTLFEAVPALGTVSAHGAGRAKLMPVGFEHAGFELGEGVNRLGRDPGQNHHVILSSHVSRSHCELLVSGNAVWVRDLNSHNGTYVNGERITEKELKPGDKLGLSRRVTMVLVMDAELQKPIEVEMSGEAGGPGHSRPPTARDSASVEAAPPPAPRPAREPVSPGGPLQAEATGGEPLPLVIEPEQAVASAVPGAAFMAPVGPHAPASAQGLPQAVAAAAVYGDQPSSVEVDSQEPDQTAVARELELQRNALAILYQISLRCLMAEDEREAEKLIANVLQRLIRLDMGFVLYRTSGGWRVSICPASRARPSDEVVRACFALASQHRGAVRVQEAARLEALGFSGPGSLLVAPLMLNGEVNGAIAVFGADPGPYSAWLVDMVVQIAAIAAAALRTR
jgi:hypothetical protein